MSRVKQYFGYQVFCSTKSCFGASIWIVPSAADRGDSRIPVTTCHLVHHRIDHLLNQTDYAFRVNFLSQLEHLLRLLLVEFLQHHNLEYLEPNDLNVLGFYRLKLILLRIQVLIFGNRKLILLVLLRQLQIKFLAEGGSFQRIHLIYFIKLWLDQELEIPIAV